MWADYLISEVSYDNNHLILQAKRHQELKNGISKGDLVDRIKISSDLSNGLSYIQFMIVSQLGKKAIKFDFFV